MASRHCLLPENCFCYVCCSSEMCNSRDTKYYQAYEKCLGSLLGIKIKSWAPLWLLQINIGRMVKRHQETCYLQFTTFGVRK